MKKTILILLCALVGVSAVVAKERQTREEYVEKYKAIAIAHMERYGIPASITMAQGILESDSGNSRLSLTSNNHFGIKCKKSWTGDKVYYDDDAKGECFRAYPSVEASYEDHADFLDQSPRYDSLFAYPADDYRSWARGLKACGYATAPDYAERLVKIIESMKLYLLDKENGNKIYAAAKSATANTETWWESNIATSDEQINPNAFRVTVNSHKGYGVYRTNHTFYVVAK
ncbi:MAG: glucosaminidase domain-containing protein, partial [Alistipes sp.]|nr:glucosaminidase domain-containing protein [Alistipes sp.]